MESPAWVFRGGAPILINIAGGCPAKGAAQKHAKASAGPDGSWEHSNSNRGRVGPGQIQGKPRQGGQIQERAPGGLEMETRTSCFSFTRLKQVGSRFLLCPLPPHETYYPL